MTRDRVAMLKDWHAGNTGCIPARPNPTPVERIATRLEAGELLSNKSMSDREFLAPLLGESDDEPEPLYPVTDGARAFQQGDNLTEYGDVEESDDDKPVVLRDVIGSGVGVHLFRDRGIISVVLVDDENGIPLANTPSAEIMLSDLAQALEMLQKGEGGEAGKDDWS